MKRIIFATVMLLLAATSVQAQEEITVGIERPKKLVEGGVYIYRDFGEITTADFNKSVDGVLAEFYESPNIKSTVAPAAHIENRYEEKPLYRQGAEVIPFVEYVWKTACMDWDQYINHHNPETMGSEDWTFGFDLTVAEGKEFKVDTVALDLLVEANPIYCIRIIDNHAQELYNSTWITKTGEYDDDEWGAGSYICITKDGVSFTYDNGKNDAATNHAYDYETWFSGLGVQKYSGFEGDNHAVSIPSAGIILTTGAYHIVVTVDYAYPYERAISFDHFTLHGTLIDTTSGITALPANDGKPQALYNLSGQRITVPVPGQLYICNGKKYLSRP